MSGSILTTIGLSKISSSTPLDQLNVTEIAVGDGNGSFPTLSPSMTSLVNEVWRDSVSAPVRDENDPSILIFEGLIPADVGGFTMREIAIFDDVGDMIAIGHTYLITKPNNATEQGMIVAVRISVKLNNASDVDVIYQDSGFIDHQGLLNKDAENAHPASAIALAIKDVISPNPVSVQEAVDWTGIFVEEFRESGDSDSDVIIKALTYISNLPYTGTKLIFERGREYVYDNTHYLYEINKLHIDLNGATLKRADAADMTTTTVNVETVSGNITYEVVDASKFKVDDYVTAFTDNTDANTNRDARRVVGVNGNTITLSAPFFFSPSKTTLPIGTTIAKVFSAFSGRPSLNDSTTPLTQGINERIFITNGTIDGNSENQINNSWRYITEILLHSKKGLISKIDFKNTAGECIVGHGINVQKNTFTDMSGSCFHTSMNDAELDNSSSSWFSDNFCKNLNLVGNAVNGHSEGVVTFSWGAGRLFVVNNFMQDGNESFLGHFTASTGANADKNLIVQGNICLNFNSVIYGIDSPAEGIVITDNIFHNCGNNTTLWKSLITNNAVQIHSNILSGTTTGFQTTKTDALRVDAGNVNRDFSGVGEPQTYITKGSGSSATPNLENFNVEVIDSDSTALRAIIADGLAGTIHYKASGNVFGSAFNTFDPSINTLNVGTNEATGTVSIKAGIFVEKIKATANEVVISGESTTDRVYVNQYGVSLNNFEALIFGNNFTNGSWKFVFSGSDLLLQRREVGVWVTKQTFSA